MSSSKGEKTMSSRLLTMKVRPFNRAPVSSTHINSSCNELLRQLPPKNPRRLRPNRARPPPSARGSRRPRAPPVHRQIWRPSPLPSRPRRIKGEKHFRVRPQRPGRRNGCSTTMPERRFLCSRWWSRRIRSMPTMKTWCSVVDRPTGILSGRRRQLRLVLMIHIKRLCTNEM